MAKTTTNKLVPLTDEERAEAREDVTRVFPFLPAAARGNADIVLRALADLDRKDVEIERLRAIADAAQSYLDVGTVDSMDEAGKRWDGLYRAVLAWEKGE